MQIYNTTLPDKQKALIWKQTENERLVFQNWGERKVKIALNKQVRPFFESLLNDGVINYAIISQAPMREVFVDIYGKVGPHFARRTYGGIKSGNPFYEVKRRRRFVPTPEVEALESIWLQYMRKFALTEAGQRIVGITETTIETVRLVLDEAIKEGMGIEKAARLLVKEWTGISRMRAKRIARTEIISGSNAGSFIGAESTGLDLEKIWIRTYDTRTRDSHKGIENVGMQEKFQVGGSKMMYPGDPAGGAGETINCRCAIGYQVLE